MRITIQDIHTGIRTTRTIPTDDLTHQFHRVVWTQTGWSICLAGRRGLGTSYCTPISHRFKTKKEAGEWKRKHLAKSPYEYWVAEPGRFYIDEGGNIKPCRKSEGMPVPEVCS